jgi:hypothetical protein
MYMQLKKYLPGLGILVAVVLVTLVCRTLILSGKPVVSLAPASQLGGIVAQSLNAAGTGPNGLVDGRNYKISNVHYFDNKAWIVATINSLNPTNTATAVLKQYGGAYKIVLGPDTSFSVNDTQSLPADVLNYLQTQVTLQ